MEIEHPTQSISPNSADTKTLQKIEQMRGWPLADQLEREEQ